MLALNYKEVPDWEKDAINIQCLVFKIIEIILKSMKQDTQKQRQMSMSPKALSLKTQTKWVNLCLNCQTKKKETQIIKI